MTHVSCVMRTKKIKKNNYTIWVVVFFTSPPPERIQLQAIMHVIVHLLTNIGDSLAM